MERPVSLVDRRIRTLLVARKSLVMDALERFGKVPTDRMGDVMEIDMEVQRLQLGFKPNNLVDILPRDINWRRQIDFNQTKKDQDPIK